VWPDSKEDRSRLTTERGLSAWTWRVRVELSTATLKGASSKNTARSDPWEQELERMYVTETTFG
jgi:hypothetical protein